MKAKYRWLLLPPALALVLFMGPLRQPAPAAETTTANTPSTESAEPETGTGPELPGLDQVAFTLVGVLLLGAAGIAVYARIHGHKSGGAATGLLSVRQSMRLSGRHHVHAVQFEDQLLLLGECDGQLSVLHAGPDANADADEGQIARRDAEEEDEGAVPIDLVIPRPAKPSPQRKKAAAAALKSADFQTLLKLARRES